MSEAVSILSIVQTLHPTYTIVAELREGKLSGKMIYAPAWALVSLASSFGSAPTQRLLPVIQYRDQLAPAMLVFPGRILGTIVSVQPNWAQGVIGAITIEDLVPLPHDLDLSETCKTPLLRKAALDAVGPWLKAMEQNP